MRPKVVNLIAFAECSTIIWGTLYYQKLSKNWIYLQYFCTSFTVFGIIFICLFFNESPKFLYSKGKFNEARYSIQKMAEFNGVNKKEDFDFVFDKEVKNNEPIKGTQESIPPITNAANE